MTLLSGGCGASLHLCALVYVPQVNGSKNGLCLLSKLQAPAGTLTACPIYACCAGVCSLTLSQFNPLLEEVALIRESGQLMTSIAPAEGKLPAESGQVSWLHNFHPVHSLGAVLAPPPPPNLLVCVRVTWAALQLSATSVLCLRNRC